MIRHITPAGLDPQVPLTPGVRAGDWLFVSGQIANSADGTVLVGDFEKEVELSIDNVAAVLEAAGATLADLVKVNAFLSNPLLFARFNAVYAERFPAPRPARTSVIVSFGHPDVRVEIEAIAYLGSA